MSAPTTLEGISAELRGLRTLVESVAVLLKPASQSRPLTAEELIVRWKVPGRTTSEQLHNLAEKCRARGLRRMEGSRGIHATYMTADVIAAENFASGRSNRRRHAA
jgi:hypothetical protein